MFISGFAEGYFINPGLLLLGDCQAITMSFFVFIILAFLKFVF